MADAGITGTAVGGFAGGLADAILEHRQDQRQQQEFEEQRKDQFFRQMFPILAANAPDPSVLEPFVQQFAPGVFGDAKKPGKPGGAFDQVAQVMSKVKASDQPQNQAAAASTDPSVTAQVGSVPVTAPAAESAPQGPQFGSLMGVPQMTAEQKATRDQELQVKSRLGLADAARRILPTLQKTDPSMTLGGALDFLEGRAVTAPRNVIPHIISASVKASGVSPEDAVDQKGNPVDLSKSDFWNIVKDNNGQTYVEPAKAPAGAAAAELFKLAPGDAGQFQAAALMSLGVADPTKLKSDDPLIAKMTPIAAKMAQDKLSDADALRGVLLDLRKAQTKADDDRTNNLPDADSVQQDARQIPVNGTTYNYVDLGNYTGADAKNAARKAAEKNGVVAVSSQQAQQLNAVAATVNNLDAYLDQLRPKLPTKADGTAARLRAGGANELATWLKTDDQLAAAKAWDTEIVPMLRGLQSSGRISVQLLDTALAARPVVSGLNIDTQESADQKISNLKGILGRTVEPILKGNGATQPTASVVLNGKKITGTQAKIDAFKKLHPDAVDAP